MNTVDIPNIILLFIVLLNVPRLGDAESFPNRTISRQSTYLYGVLQHVR